MCTHINSSRRTHDLLLFSAQIVAKLFIIPPLQRSWKGGILVSCRPPVRPSVRLTGRPAVCGQNRVRSVSSAILFGSISYLHILSSNFRRCVSERRRSSCSSLIYFIEENMTAGDLVSQISKVWVMHHAEEDKLPPFDYKSLPCVRALSNSNKYVYRQSQGWTNSDHEVKWAECSLIIWAGCWLITFLVWSSIAQSVVCECLFSLLVILTSPGHQQPWYWLCRICKCWFYLRKDFKYLCHINVE